MLASSAADRGLKHRSGQANEIKMSMCCIKEKIKDWLVRNWNNVSILNNMSIRVLCQRASTYTTLTKRVGLVQGKPHHHLTENVLVFFLIKLSKC